MGYTWVGPTQQADQCLAAAPAASREAERCSQLSRGAVGHTRSSFAGDEKHGGHGSATEMSSRDWRRPRSRLRPVCHCLRDDGLRVRRRVGRRGEPDTDAAGFEPTRLLPDRPRHSRAVVCVRADGPRPHLHAGGSRDTHSRRRQADRQGLPLRPAAGSARSCVLDEYAVTMARQPMTHGSQRWFLEARGVHNGSSCLAGSST